MCLGNEFHCRCQQGRIGVGSGLGQHLADTVICLIQVAAGEQQGAVWYAGRAGRRNMLGSASSCRSSALRNTASAWPSAPDWNSASAKVACVLIRSIAPAERTAKEAAFLPAGIAPSSPPSHPMLMSRLHRLRAPGRQGFRRFALLFSQFYCCAKGHGGVFQASQCVQMEAGHVLDLCAAGWGEPGRRFGKGCFEEACYRCQFSPAKAELAGCEEVFSACDAGPVDFGKGFIFPFSRAAMGDCSEEWCQPCPVSRLKLLQCAVPLRTADQGLCFCKLFMGCICERRWHG